MGSWHVELQTTQLAKILLHFLTGESAVEHGHVHIPCVYIIVMKLESELYW